MTSGFSACACPVCLYGLAPQYKVQIGSVTNNTCTDCSTAGGDYILDWGNIGNPGLCAFYDSFGPMCTGTLSVVTMSFLDAGPSGVELAVSCDAGTAVVIYRIYGVEDCLDPETVPLDFENNSCYWPSSVQVTPIPPAANTDPRDWNCCIPIQLGCAPGSTVVTVAPCAHIHKEFGASLVCCKHSDAECGTTIGACCKACGDEDFPSSEVTLGAECSDLEDVQCYICYSSSGNASPCGGN